MPAGCHIFWSHFVGHKLVTYVVTRWSQLVGHHMPNHPLVSLVLDCRECD